MKFEHLIEVNDLSKPLQELLTREELWFGLLCRAEDSRAFLPGLEACHIIERSSDALVRDLHFGNTVIRDRVSLSTLDRVCFESEASDQHAGGSLTISIEEPEPGALFLRFATRPACPKARAAKMGPMPNLCARPITSRISIPFASSA